VVAAGGFSAGAKVDRLVKTYRSRVAPHATYSECLTHILSLPENAALKVAYAAETGRGK
jgi:hypothetical protein